MIFSKIKNNKKTIQNQIIFRVVILVIVIITFNWLLNVVFLENIYVDSKTKKLLSMYEELNSFDYNYYLTSSTLKESEEFKKFQEHIGQLCRRNNVTFIVADSSANVLMTSIYDPANFNLFLRDVIFERDAEYIKDVIFTKEKYTMCIIKDPIDDMEYAAMWGNFDNGDFFMMRVAMAGIRDNVYLSSNFMLIISILAIAFGIFFANFISKRVTSPIGELTEISKRMANLDFDAKYVGKSNNEIDVLGENFNQMSSTLESTIEQLRDANNELQKDVDAKTRIDNMRKEFLANVSHELKTPIAIIQGYAEGLKEGIIDDPESRDYYCEVIVDETNKMNKMVKQLMTLNQLEFGGEEPDLSEFNICELVENFVQANAILSKNIDINVNIPEKNILVYSDEYRIEEVLRNYYNNALNHLDEKKRISIDVVRDDDKVKISVFNTGNNIPEDSLYSIWEKFYKVDKARTRAYGGSGIGLSIVKAIMEMLEGDYGAQNIEDGVEFWFALKVK